MWQYIKLKGSVGKNGTNYPDDVRTIQARLIVWIYKGFLPKIDLFEVDGSCGEKTKTAIGAFQFRIMKHKYPDCRVDPGGKTLEALYQSLITPPTEEEEEYIKWLMDQNNEPPKSKPDPPKWIVSDEDAYKIRSAWGAELAQWAAIPPQSEVESKEFEPPTSCATSMKPSLPGSQQTLKTSAQPALKTGFMSLGWCGQIMGFGLPNGVQQDRH